MTPENWIGLIEVTIWPIVLLSFFLIFRSQLPSIFKFIQTIKYKDFEISLSKEIKTLEESAKKIDVVDSLENNKKKLIDQELYLLAATSPREAMLSSWKKIEALARDVVQGYLDPEDGEVDTFSPMFVRWALGTKFILKNEHLRVFDELKSVRNKLSHNDFMEPSESESLAYINAVQKIHSYLEMQKR
jgi:hypothetical protein